MTAMRHLVIEQPGRLAWRECAGPRLETNVDALVRPLVVGRCDLDVAIVRGVVPILGGSALGHECIAEVIEVRVELVRVRRPWVTDR